MRTIAQKELRNNSGDVLRRAEGGEEFTITVSGRPVAQLGPLRAQSWVRLGDLDALWTLAKDPTLLDDLQQLGAGAVDPFDDAPAS